MKKTNTKKSTSTKKAPVTAKAVTPVVTETTKKKAVVKKSAPKKTSPTKTTAKKTVTSKKVIEAKKPAQKKVAPVKKAAPAAPKVETKVTHNAVPKSEEKTHHISEKNQKIEAHEGVKMLGIFHLVANIISGGTFGIIVVLAYFLWKKSELSQLEKETCFEILNFNISFLLYTLVLAISVVGIVLIPFLALAWLVLLVLGFMSHLNGKNYKYSFVICFLP